MAESQQQLPPVTLVIEWENAIDVEDQWTKAAMIALEREMVAVADRCPVRPRILYLYDSGAVEPGIIERTIDSVAPALRRVADVAVVPAPGLKYYELKNFGIARAETDIAILLDSDAAPRPGWLENLLKPFADETVMVVGGFTVLAYEDLLSRTMALSWFFDLADEGDRTANRLTIHANNCAVRTGFFRDHPFPDLPMFKKQCEYWRKQLTADGIHIVRTADAMTDHAPHPGFGYVLWRGWKSGADGDALAFYTGTRGRLARVRSAFRHFGKKVWRSSHHIVRRGGAVGLAVWQLPAALAIALTYYLVNLAAQLTSALTRSFETRSEEESKAPADQADFRLPTRAFRAR